jgi:hypothetical protein
LARTISNFLTTLILLLGMVSPAWAEISAVTFGYSADDGKDHAPITWPTVSSAGSLNASLRTWQGSFETYINDRPFNASPASYPA